jgi:hypothetical protein
MKEYSVWVIVVLSAAIITTICYIGVGYDAPSRTAPQKAVITSVVGNPGQTVITVRRNDGIVGPLVNTAWVPIGAVGDTVMVYGYRGGSRLYYAAQRVW